MTFVIGNTWLSSESWNHGNTTFIVLPFQYKYLLTTRTWCISIKPRDWTNARPDGSLIWLTLTWKLSISLEDFLLDQMYYPAILTCIQMTWTIQKQSSFLIFFSSTSSTLSSTPVFPQHSLPTPLYYNTSSPPWNHPFSLPFIPTCPTGRSLRVFSPTGAMYTFSQTTHFGKP